MNRFTLKVLALVTAIVALVSACGVAGATNSTPGHLNWGWVLPTSWDPVSSTAGTDVHALSMVYSGLTKLDPSGKAVPDAAESWEYNDDGTAVIFTLRPDQSFQDGTALDAAAVKASLERGRDAEYSTKRAQLEVIESIDVLSPTQVQLNLSRPDYQIPDLLSGLTGFLVSPTAFEAGAEALATQPVGSGPFEVTSYTPGSEAELKKFDGYWNADHIYIDSITHKEPADAAVIVAGLQSGQYDVVEIPPSQVEAAEAAGFDVEVNPALTVRTLDVNNTVAPFDDPKVMQAINYALDRQALIDTSAFGYGEATVQPFPEGHIGYNPDIADLYPHDIKKAKELLAEAGYPDGIEIPLTTYDTSGLAEQIQAQFLEAGIKVDIKTITRAQASQTIYIKRDAPLALDYFAGRESPAQALEVLFGPDGLMNLGRNAPEEVSAGINAVSTTPTDDPSYEQVLHHAVDTAVTSMPNVFLFAWPRIFAISPGVQDFTPYIGPHRWEDVKVVGS